MIIAYMELPSDMWSCHRAGSIAGREFCGFNEANAPLPPMGRLGWLFGGHWLGVGGVAWDWIGEPEVLGTRGGQ